MTEINADEVEAIRGVATASKNQAKGLVSERNFSQPRRLSAGRLDHLGLTIESTMQEIGNSLSVPLRSFHKLQLGSLNEVNATSLFDDLKSPFVIHVVRINGNLGMGRACCHLRG